MRSFVMLHGGSVSASSAGRGHGAEFTILLPALEPQPVPGSPRVTESITLEPLRGGLRILVVDDNEDYADMLAQALAARGNDLRVAHDGPTGFDAHLVKPVNAEHVESVIRALAAVHPDVLIDSARASCDT